MQAALLGPEKTVRERIRKYRDAGVNMLRLDPLGATPTERLDTLGPRGGAGARGVPLVQAARSRSARSSVSSITAMP